MYQQAGQELSGVKGLSVSLEEGLTKPVAFVRAKEASENLESDLQKFVLEHLAPYKHPRRVIFVEQFERTHLGQIDRSKLKELARK